MKHRRHAPGGGGIDLFRLEPDGGRTHVGAYPTEQAAKRSARLDWYSVGSCGYVMLDRAAGGLVCQGYTVRAAHVTDFVTTHGGGGSKPDPDPPPALALSVPPTHNRIAYLTSRLGRREAA